MTKSIHSKNVDLTVLYSQKKQLGLWDQIKSNTDLSLNFDCKHLARHSFNQPKTKWQYIVYFLLFCSILQIPQGEAIESRSNDGENGDSLEQNDDIDSQRNDSVGSNEIIHNLGFVHQDHKEHGHSDFVVFSDNKGKIIKFSSLSKKQEKFNLKSLLTNNKELRSNYSKAKTFINILQRNAPKKLNRSYEENDTRLIPIITSEQAEKSDKVNSRFQKLQEMHVLYLYNIKKLNNKLTLECRKESLRLFRGSQLNEDEIRNEQFKILSYVIRLQDQLINHSLAKIFNGGTCADQSSYIVIEALRKSVDIELIEITDKNDKNIFHTFTLLGRPQDTTLSDPRTWGDSTVVLDFWGYNRAITASELIAQPEKYKIFSYEGWNWKSTFFSAKIPESLKNQAYYKNLQVQGFHAYCQKIIDGLLATSFYLPYPTLQSLPSEEPDDTYESTQYKSY